MAKNTRRKTDKPRWTEADKLRKQIADIDKMDPKHENQDLQKKRRELSAQISHIVGIFW